MADEDRLSGSLQESVLTLLAFDEPFGRIVQGVLDHTMFDPPYDDIARAVLDHRRRFDKPPGRAHLDDLFATQLESSGPRAEVFRRLLAGMIEQSEGLNAEYVSSKVTAFIRHQTIKGGILMAAARIQQGGDEAVDESEVILQRAINKRAQAQHPGIFLNDSKTALKFLDRHNQSFLLGIKELDRYGIAPTRQEMFLFMAPRKRGKSQLAVHAGKQARLQRGKVLHITLEMSEELTTQRYLQAWFAIGKRDEKTLRTILEFDGDGNLSDLRQLWKAPRFNLADPTIGTTLRKLMSEAGTRLAGTVIKGFPSGTLTQAQYESYLDYMETVHRFVPDMVIIDYPDLMALDPRDIRTSTGRTYVGLRGICQQRNHALVVLSQGNRDSETAKLVTTKHTAEDISKIATCDTAITYSQTESEKKLGLARLLVAANRGDADGFQVLISQHYATAQFCTGSAPISSAYDRLLKQSMGEGDGTTTDDC